MNHIGQGKRADILRLHSCKPLREFLYATVMFLENIEAAFAVWTPAKVLPCQDFPLVGIRGSRSNVWSKR